VKAVLFRGTGCAPPFMNAVVDIVRESGKFDIIRNVCWHKPDLPGIADDIADYANPFNWNDIKGKFDLAIGHSAGGFTVTKENAKTNIVINPFIGVYLSGKVDHILHAKDDLLVIPDLPKSIPVKQKKKVKLYDGTHSTVPTKLLKEIIKRL